MTEINAAAQFGVKLADVQKYGNGHINSTFIAADEKGNKYILQKINNHVFKDVDGLMRNIVLVTEFLSSRRPGSSLEFLKTGDGKAYCLQDGAYYRMYRFVEGVCIDKAESANELEKCGKAFGAFQQQLDGFDATLLTETIPLFHNTVNRFKNLEIAAKEDKFGRLKGVKDEYAFLAERKGELSTMLDMQKEGKLVTRVTHNDTKINNVLLDSTTLEPKVVIDLDTVMPGLAGNDFGDSIRSGASTAAEDEKDVDKVALNFDYYRAFARGFLGSCGKALNADEIRTLPLGAKFMTYECAARFLTDYLEGNVYFHVAYEEHNLVRCHTQMKLISETEKHWNEIGSIIEQEANRL